MKNSFERYRSLIKDTLSFLKERDLVPALSVKPPVRHEVKKAVPEVIKSRPIESPIKVQKPAVAKPVKPSEPSSQEAYLKKMISKLVPEIVLTDVIPQKNEKSISGKRKICVILSFSSNEEELQFLKQLAKTIHAQVADTKILDGKRSFQDRKDKFSSMQAQLLIAWEKDLSFFEKDLELSSETKTLFGIPILLLASPLDYAKDPQVKEQLWMRITQSLQ